MDRWMDGPMDRWMDGSMDRWIDGWMDGWVDRWFDASMDAWINGSMDEWIDGWMDGTASAAAAVFTNPMSSVCSNCKKVSIDPSIHPSLDPSIHLTHRMFKNPAVFIHFTDRRCKNLLVGFPERN